MTRRTRTKRSPEASLAKQTAALARTADMPERQIERGGYVITETKVANEADYRDRIRSKQTFTVRKLTRIEKLKNRGVLDEREALACEWYAKAHAARYDTQGITANYGEAFSGGNTSFDHLPKTKLQWDALAHYDLAREAIPAPTRTMFERIVIHGRPLGKLALTFRMAARRLLNYIEGKVAL